MSEQEWQLCATWEAKPEPFWSQAVPTSEISKSSVLWLQKQLQDGTDGFEGKQQNSHCNPWIKGSVT